MEEQNAAGDEEAVARWELGTAVMVPAKDSVADGGRGTVVQLPQADGLVLVAYVLDRRTEWVDPDVLMPAMLEEVVLGRSVHIFKLPACLLSLCSRPTCYNFRWAMHQLPSQRNDIIVASKRSPGYMLCSCNLQRSGDTTVVLKHSASALCG